MKSLQEFFVLFLLLNECRKCKFNVCRRQALLENAETPERNVWKTLNNNDLNQVADQRFSLKQWFAAGAHSCRLRKSGSAHCYLRISGMCAPSEFAAIVGFM